MVWKLLTADISFAALRTGAWLWLVLSPKWGPMLYDNIPSVAGWLILVSQTLQTFVMWALCIYVLKGK